MREVELGLDHPDVAYTCNQIAWSLEEQGYYKAGEPFLRNALDIRARVLGRDHESTAFSAKRLADNLYWQSRYDDAEPYYFRALAMQEAIHGANSLEVAETLSDLGLMRYWQERYADAVPLYQRAIAIREAELGPEDLTLATTLRSLANVYYYWNDRYTDALLLYRRALEIRKAKLGAEHRLTATSFQDTADTLGSLGRHAEAVPLSRQALEIRERVIGPAHSDIAYSLNQLAWSMGEQGDYRGAEPLLQRALAMRREVLGVDHSYTATSTQNLADNLAWQMRLSEAEPLYKQALEIRERTLGPNNIKTADSLSRLGKLYRWQSRKAEAERYLRSAVDVRRSARGPDHPDVGESLNELAEFLSAEGELGKAASLYEQARAIFSAQNKTPNTNLGITLYGLGWVRYLQGSYSEADNLLTSALEIYRQVYGAGNARVGLLLNSLASTRYYTDRNTADELYRQALRVNEQALGPNHVYVAGGLLNIAWLARSKGQYEEALAHYNRARNIYQKGLGDDHDWVSLALGEIARTYLYKQDWANAMLHWRQSAELMERRALRAFGRADIAPAGMAEREISSAKSRFLGLIKAAYRVASQSPGQATQLAEQMFAIAQWSESSNAAAALMRMAARSAQEREGLARIVREHQDLGIEWQAKDRALFELQSAPKAQSNAAAQAELRARLAAIDQRLSEISRILAADFPDYAELASPRPVSFAETRGLLREEEALILFVPTEYMHPTPGETFLWVVTKAGSRWVRAELGTLALSHEVAALRCGLDYTAWRDDGAERCAGLVGSAINQAPAVNDPLPFDASRAHRLYDALFRATEDLIAGKHLLIVPSGPLTQLPFHVLVTEAPRAGADHRDVAWLARRHAITVLPAVSSLKALRHVARPSAATKPMIGFGNPLLDGPDDRYAERARLARDSQQCRDAGPQRVASLRGLRGGGVAALATHGGLADLAHLKAQAPLPETAEELCAVARDLGADVGDLRLGARASEREIKALSEAGALAQYRIVHFATHGALAGELKGTTEPGLILTPPATATPEDDGYLSASEIAALKLDAEWVILSACNTAAAGASGAEALSGLARAFFYAQARALLVSHWEVYSDATVKLITAAGGEITRDGSVGRAEALRRAMLALIDTGEPHEAHPAYWAPFVVVGEGAR